MEPIMKPCILIVDDDAQICSMLKTMLELSDYPFLTARNGKEALSLFLSRKPEIVLLDLGLPDMDGVDIIQKIREFSDTPILVLSARTEDTDKIEALDAGADDYLSKPFSVDELCARLRVIERRLEKSGTLPESPFFKNGDLRINYEEQSVWIGNEKLHLTPIEYRLLVLFAKNIGKLLTRTWITQQIWGSSWDSDLASLRVYMTTLRKKLHHRYIETSFGVGYQMVREEADSEAGS